MQVCSVHSIASGWSAQHSRHASAHCCLIGMSQSFQIYGCRLTLCPLIVGSRKSQSVPERARSRGKETATDVEAKASSMKAKRILKCAGLENDIVKALYTLPILYRRSPAFLDSSSPGSQDNRTETRSTRKLVCGINVSEIFSDNLKTVIT